MKQKKLNIINKKSLIFHYFEMIYMGTINILDTNLRIGNNNVLQNINFQLDNGEMKFLIGRTGSGKTTFINSIFANLEIEKSEKFEVLGYDLNKINESSIPLLRRKIGFVFQDFKLLNDRSIYENLEFVLKATGHNVKQEIDDKVKRALKLVGINTSLDKLPNELSGGEQQRVAIARALLNNPELILADEPTGNLDPETSEEVMNLLREIHLSGNTIIMATHDYTLIYKYPNKTLKCDNATIFEVMNN